MAVVENFDLRWDALSQSIDNAGYRIPEDTAPRVIDFLSDSATGVLWTQLNAQKIRDLHRLIGAEGPRTTKTIMIPAIDLVIRSFQLERPHLERGSPMLVADNDPAYQFLEGLQPLLPPAVAPVLQPAIPLQPVIRPVAPPPVVPPPVIANANGLPPPAARDLPRILLSGGVHRAPVQRAARAPIDLSASVDDDPIEVDGDSDENHDIGVSTTSTTTSTDLGTIALRTLNNLNMSCVEWITVTDRERPWRVARNQHEAMNIARVFDLIGIRSNNFIKATMLKRIIALQHFDSTGNVNVLDVVQGSTTELLPTRFLNAIYTQLQRRTQSQSRSSTSSSSSQSGSNGRHRQHGKQKPPANSGSSSQPPSKKHRGPPSSGGSAGSQ
jgi:hypothetical protein